MCIRDSNGDASYQDRVAKGYLKEAVLNYIRLLVWSPKGEREIFTLPEMIEVFDAGSYTHLDVYKRQ